MRPITLAATQMACTWDRARNIAEAERLVRAAAVAGAQVILLQELFETPYFCAETHPQHLDLATTAEENAAVGHFRRLAADLGVVIPVSFYERAGQVRYNTTVIVDADGSVAGLYRKTHIPHSVGYEEKYYFTPGDTGLRAVDTRFARIGVGICWDQWFPETARALVLDGAEVLLFPTAIGSEPLDPSLDAAPHWQRVMQGHAAANMVPVVASNRVGIEDVGPGITFFGASFITDATGAKLAEMGRTTPGFITATVDLDAVARSRAAWGLFRDRRPAMYGGLLTSDGQTRR